MFHLDNNSGIDVMPVIKQTLSRLAKWFTEGDNQTPPSYPGADWFNIVQAELLNVLKEAGIKPAKNELNQLSNAIKAIIDNNKVEIPDASLKTKGIVQLSSATDSKSEIEAATPLAVKNAYDCANVANANAISANSNANNAHKNIEILGGRIAGVEDKFTSGGIESRVYSNDKRFYFVVRDDSLTGLFDAVKNKLLWSFRDDYFEIGRIPIGRIDGLNDYILAMYNQLFNSNGFTKLPNGMIIQWGLANFQATNGANGSIQSFYTEFPNACCAMLCSDGGVGVHITSAGAIDKRKFRCWSKESTPRNGVMYTNTAMFYIAIGF